MAEAGGPVLFLGRIGCSGGGAALRHYYWLLLSSN